MKLISIIVPCLNEQEVIPIFYRTVTEVLDSLENAEYELLFVDDGSDDRLLRRLVDDFSGYAARFGRCRRNRLRKERQCEQQ